jgi:transcriptional regulator with XRE-family HTH domain
VAPEDDEGSSEADLNEVVAYNFKRAREMYGWTQDEVADRLAPYLGVRLPQASISGIERGYRGRRRELDAQELLAFACCFDVPLVWFFIPPPGDNRPLRNSGEYVQGLYTLLLGREDQLGLLYERFRELGYAEPDAVDETLEKMSGGHHTGRTMADYRTRRKELLIALLDQYADEFDRAAEEMGSLVDRLRQLGLRAFVSASMNDLDFSLPAERRGTVHLDTDEEIEAMREARLAEEHAAVKKDQTTGSTEGK